MRQQVNMSTAAPVHAGPSAAAGRVLQEGCSSQLLTKASSHCRKIESAVVQNESRRGISCAVAAPAWSRWHPLSA